MIDNFIYGTPTILRFGKGVIKDLPEVLSQYGKRVLMTYGGG
ncbi:MAG TPA: NADH-dependent alcohol dehydrogenase, partial [Clostridiales bacterium]|nr:NADH-dependent alcohol dehydrogenase [Clostridiales bacterium]